MTMFQDIQGVSFMCYLIQWEVHKFWVPSHPGNKILDGGT
jgi:hypothetical protein